MPISEDYAFKIIIVGDSSVGKSCLLRRFQGECFDEGYPATFGVDFVMRRIELDDKIIKLVIWDTAGQERFKALTRNYYQNADAVIVAFDVTCASSYSNVPNWINEAKRHGREELKIVLVACKCDCVRNRVVQRHEGQRMAIEFGVMYMETSAKEMLNVNETFISLAAQLRNLAEVRDQRLFERSHWHHDVTIKIRRQLAGESAASYADGTLSSSDRAAVVGSPKLGHNRRNGAGGGCKFGSSQQGRGNSSKCN